MSTVTLEDARKRVPGLPVDDDAAQDIIDEQEAWLARRVGALAGSRTETFYVGLSCVSGKLALSRFTDAVTVTDGGSSVDAAHFRLVDRGSAIERTYQSPSPIWTGPYVSVDYTPSDELEVQRVIYGLLELAATSVGGLQSEQMGAYAYSRGSTPAQSRAALVASLLPSPDPLLTIRAVSRRASAGDPVINRPESEVVW